MKAKFVIQSRVMLDDRDTDGISATEMYGYLIKNEFAAEREGMLTTTWVPSKTYYEQRGVYMTQKVYGTIRVVYQVEADEAGEGAERAVLYNQPGDPESVLVIHQEHLKRIVEGVFVP